MSEVFDLHDGSQPFFVGRYEYLPALAPKEEPKETEVIKRG